MFRLFIKLTVKLDYYKIQTYECNLLLHQFTCVYRTPYNTLFHKLSLLVYSCSEIKYFVLLPYIILINIIYISQNPKRFVKIIFDYNFPYCLIFSAIITYPFSYTVAGF